MSLLLDTLTELAEGQGARDGRAVAGTALPAGWPLEFRAEGAATAVWLPIVASGRSSISDATWVAILLVMAAAVVAAVGSELGDLGRLP